MTQFRTENTVKPYDTRDESLLHEGHYREWFYKGLDKRSLAWIKAPVPEIPVNKEVEDFNKTLTWESSDRQEWMRDRGCADVDPGVFFPYRTNEYLDPKAQWRRYCPVCPVRDECLAFGLAGTSNMPNSSTGNYGIYGGKLLVKERDSKTIVAADETTLKPKGRPRKVR